MQEVTKGRMVLSIDNEEVAKIYDLDDETRYIEVAIIHQRISGDTWIEFDMTKFNTVRQKSEVVQFEESLDITDEQRAALYSYWGSSKAIIVRDTSDRLQIPIEKARQIILTAFRYDVLKKGHNCVWKVIDNIVQERWKVEAVALKRGEGRDIKKVSLQEEIDGTLNTFNNRGTEAQKRIARGESSIEVVSSKSNEEDEGDHIYSPARAAKAQEKAQWEKNVQVEKEKAMKSMNEGNQVVSKSVKKILPPMKKK